MLVLVSVFFGWEGGKSAGESVLFHIGSGFNEGTVCQMKPKIYVYIYIYIYMQMYKSFLQVYCLYTF